MKRLNRDMRYFLFFVIFILILKNSLPILEWSIEWNLKSVGRIFKDTKHKKIEKEKKKELKYRIDAFYKNFKVIFDINDYQINATEYVTFFGSGINYEIVPKKRPEYKSKYFDAMYTRSANIYIYDEDKQISDANTGKVEFFKTPLLDMFLNLLDYEGFRPYVLNELIYDKSRGNDFESIEKILDKYEIMYIFSFRAIWGCGEIKDNKESVFMYVIDKECRRSEDYYKEEKIEKYGKRFAEYFSVDREFKKIDWFKFMKYHNITPMIELRFLGETSEEEIEKIKNEIKKYYNDKDFIIRLGRITIVTGEKGEPRTKEFITW